MSSLVVRKWWGELIKEGKASPVELDLTINRLSVDEQGSTAAQSLVRVDISSRHQGPHKPQPGQYTLEFVFNGREESHSVEVTADGLLLFKD